MKNQGQQKPIYFETQKALSNQCGVHALNNILGKQVYDSQTLNEICKNLSSKIINPHKHIFGGDFDANIIIIALETQGYECCWMDNRKKSEIFVPSQMNFKERTGFLINKQVISSNFTAFMKNMVGLSSRHWIAVRSIDKKYYLLDSKRQKPEQIDNIQKFLSIQAQMGSHIIEVLQRSRQQVQQPKPTIQS